LGEGGTREKRGKGTAKRCNDWKKRDKKRGNINVGNHSKKRSIPGSSGTSRRPLRARDCRSTAMMKTLDRAGGCKRHGTLLDLAARVEERREAKNTYGKKAKKRDVGRAWEDDKKTIFTERGCEGESNDSPIRKNWIWPTGRTKEQDALDVVLAMIENERKKKGDNRHLRR